MKKIFSVLLVTLVTALVGYNISAQKQDKSLLNLASIEAIAGCEVSSDASNNSGYCSSLHGGNGDACVDSGSGGETRCSGNY